METNLLKLVFLIFITSSQISFANSRTDTQCNLRHSFRKGFLEITEVAEKSVAVSRSLSKVLRISAIGTEKDSYCSASLVSKNGHILLASHCLDSCRYRWDAERPDKTNANSLFEFIPKSSRSEKVCSMQVNGVKVEVQVIAMNPCPIENMYADFMEKKPVRKECLESNDTAIVQVPRDLIPATQCVEISWDKPPLNAPVTALGFPIRTQRKMSDAGDSNGVNSFGSFGKIVRQNHCNLDNSNVRQKMDSKIIDWRNALGENVIQSTADIVQGSSGGPLVNDKGQIIAVTSGYISSRHGEESTCEGNSLFSGVRNLDQSLKRWNANLKKEELTCR